VLARVSLTPEQRDLLKLLGYLYLRYGCFDKAVVLFEALLLQNPQDDHAAHSLACACVRTGRYDSALAQLDRLLDGGDFSALTYLLRGQALSALGRREEAARSMLLYMDARTRAQPHSTPEDTSARRRKTG